MPLSRRRLLHGALGACGLGWAPLSPGQTALTDAQAKASALFNFARYIEWPDRAFASTQTPFVFCIVGRDSLQGALTLLDNRSLNGRPTQVKRVFGAEELRGCSALYIDEAEDRRTQALLRSLAGAPVLTVGDAGGFAEAGGAIMLTVEDGRVRFDINRAALEQAQLRASANLLRLARNVRQP
jgi:hypothetical protein